MSRSSTQTFTTQIVWQSLVLLLAAAILTALSVAPALAQSGASNASDAIKFSGKWPRSFQTADGSTLTLHQPQVTAWKGFKTTTALIASEYRKKGAKNPAFGVITVTANTSPDREDDEITLSDLAVTNVNFSTLSRGDLSEVAVKIGSLLPARPLTLSLTRFRASLADQERMADVKGLSTDAPPIFVSEKPAVLLQTNGEPATAPVKGTEGVQFVVNTNWDLLVAGKPRVYFLRIGKSWVSASDIKGPWTPVTELPAALSKLPKDDNWKEATAAIPPQPFKDGAVPVVIVTDRPSELILVKGAPKLKKIPGTRLEWVSNANTDVFFDPSDKTWYFLTSGRWFKTANLMQGPWAFASDSLPDAFQLIPDGQPYSVVRASIPGTSESDEARLQASIPTTARVSRKGPTVNVTYFGEPEFKPIKGTNLAYAVNTNYTVIRVGQKYYVLYKGVWFVGDTPEGPFVPADKVPNDIYKMPPSSPVYNATYVRVYDATPEYVVYGYTAGYLWGFPAWGTFVYGTGWYYPPYWVLRPGWGPIYRPWHVSYGSGVYYLPGRGTFDAHWGRAYGPYGGIAAGGIYNRNTGGYVRGGVAWGPFNQGAYVAVRGPDGNVYRAGIIDGHVYKSWDRKYVTPTNRWASRDGTRAPGNWRQGDPKALGAKQGDLFANKNGDVFRNKKGQWQQHGPKGWQRPSQKAPATKKRKQPVAQPRANQEFLDRHQAGRERGEQLFQQRQEIFQNAERRFQHPSFERFHGFEGRRGGGGRRFR
ncbi:MAG: hypothetical protein MPJ78_11910 [Hyphomicrobiaceae bacterium]|nr:hypothetical protein [Hyphomicrobiaceae bacterium]